MITLKFGGTSVKDAEAIRRVASVVRRYDGQSRIVVVSAAAGVTRSLIDMGRVAASGDREAAGASLREVVDRHIAMVAALVLESNERERLTRSIEAIGSEIEALVGGLALLREFGAATRDATASYGELLSAPVVAAGLSADGLEAVAVDARSFMITTDDFGRAEPLLDQVEPRVRDALGPILGRGAVPVVQGYIGRTPEGRPTTMGFEASDYSATIIGAAMGAERVEIWTDVDGVLSADDRIVAGARSIGRLTYGEAGELASLGARVLHRRTTMPAAHGGLPVLVRNSWNPEHPGSRIDGEGAGTAGVRSVALLQEAGLLRVRWRDPDPESRLTQVFLALDRHRAPVRLSTTAPTGVAVVLAGVDRPETGLVRELGQVGRVEWMDACSVVSVVGEQAASQADVTERVAGALHGVPIHMVQQGGSDRSVSFVVDRSAGEDAVRRIHRVFFDGDSA